MEKKRSAVALGIFDGLHLGHRAVINSAAAQSKNGLSAAVFTFEPECALRKAGGSSGYIYTSSEKELLLRERLGIRSIFCPQFEDMRELSGEEFAEEILSRCMNAAYVCCGSDFRFGKGASCGHKELADFGKRLGFEVEVIGSVEHDGSAVSSSRIRELLLSGDVSAANRLLGEEYFIRAVITQGDHIGRTIDFPTINQDFAEGRLIPRYGVYATFTDVGGKRFPSVTNIGVKPTIKGERRPLAETHIIGFGGDIYGVEAVVSFRSFIRPEVRFSSLDELKKQIKSDTESAIKIL